jgi:hypothetical protein
MGSHDVFKSILAAAAFGLGAAIIPPAGPAEAATLRIVGNTTEIEVTADLAGLGLTPSVFGSATAGTSAGGNLLLGFPITGGTLETDTGNALIEHEGSGASLTDGTTTVNAGNFLINTAPTVATVFGDVDVDGSLVGSDLPLFTLGAGNALPGVQLLISPTLAGALTGVFGAPDLTNAEFGYARPDVAAVPLPAGAWLVLTALGALGLARARRIRTTTA